MFSCLKVYLEITHGCINWLALKTKYQPNQPQYSPSTNFGNEKLHEFSFDYLLRITKLKFLFLIWGIKEITILLLLLLGISGHGKIEVSVECFLPMCHPFVSVK